LSIAVFNLGSLFTLFFILLYELEAITNRNIRYPIKGTQ